LQGLVSLVPVAHDAGEELLHVLPGETRAVEHGFGPDGVSDLETRWLYFLRFKFIFY